MNKQRGDFEIVAGLVLFLIGIILWVIFSSWSCGARWKHSGVNTSWGPIQGCLVKMPSGRWVPDDRVRDIDLSTPKQPKESQ